LTLTIKGAKTAKPAPAASHRFLASPIAANVALQSTMWLRLPKDKAKPRGGTKTHSLRIVQRETGRASWSGGTSGID
jgi:hypothetical protein